MNTTELIFAQGTSDSVKKAAQALPPFDLLKAYREARAAFNCDDIVLAVVRGDLEGFVAMPRSKYIEQAFRRWTAEQVKIHPISETAHKKLQVPIDTPAFWLAMENPDQGAVAFCAIGAFNYNMSTGGDDVEDDGNLSIN